MKVLKFGGTSIGTASRIKNLINIINLHESSIIVLSAIAGTTNTLLEIIRYYNIKDKKNKLINKLYDDYILLNKKLYNNSFYFNKSLLIIKYHFDIIKSFNNAFLNKQQVNIILAQGELISTNLFNLYLHEIGIKSYLLPALDFMKIDENNEPIFDYIKINLKKLISKITDTNLLFITQGYICRNINNDIDNLKRGGSDYTASIIGSAIQSSEVQIWTDIDGMHNNDPRIVQNTSYIPQLSFEEAAELSYFGAKILHPCSVLPAQKNNIPIRLLNTMKTYLPGTLINSERRIGIIKAIAAKDNITFINIKSSRMLMAYGFLKKVFEVFDKYKTPIDMITTSEIAISLTIDNNKFINKIQNDIKNYGEIEINENQTIICIVGDLINLKSQIAINALEAVKNIPLHMICYGGSKNNISFLIDTNNKYQTMNLLHNRLFKKI